MKDLKELWQKALDVRQNAYVPYSHFAVGAVVCSQTGQEFAGCNVENASYGLTSCAERNAVFQAVAAGEQQLSEIMIVADSVQPVAPCGACRQVMQEFGIQTVHMSNTKGEIITYRLDELLPSSFSKKQMGV